MQYELIEKRFIIIKLIRDFFHSEGFTEVDTPLLCTSPGIEPYLEPFTTRCRFPGKKQKMYYLPYSPEFFMKRLLANGFNTIFQIAHCFRNEELSQFHQPEFLMLEWYRKNATYLNLMEDVKKLFTYISSFSHFNKLQNSKEHNNLTLSWEYISVKELFLRYLNINLDHCKESLPFYTQLIKAGIPVDPHFQNDWNTLFFSAFLNAIEPHLKGTAPLFITDYPASVSALAKTKSDDVFYAERFELYINTIEIVNGCTELTDYQEHLQRYQQCNAERTGSRKKPYPLDKVFLYAIKNDFPASAGAALGIDRLIMLFLDQNNISNIMPFPVY
ncbi:MAG: EF-P lysine aminoacylase GenX [Candidatus Fischerbacteria bacterium RBG_13_37_8]|uniref:EF-P lysine aminoacylase GenX n=1 Tax=Candidatus Fischerbacteria bacterium RBG_13_37_8 TaxID=1817863 RepID=A0A1F5VMX0_9BACT|nr:MAG: EF-P lysine aminoacylase GenX [Candidatus Fischerbacteria bacterium RBG_13_37_8]